MLDDALATAAEGRDSENRDHFDLSSYRALQYMSLAGPGSADQDQIALMGEELAACKLRTSLSLIPQSAYPRTRSCRCPWRAAAWRC